MGHPPSVNSFSRKFRKFFKWMQDHGIQYSDALHFMMGDGIVSGLGVRALCDLQEGDLVAIIPKQVCLTVKTTGAAEIIEAEKLGGGLGLSVALMYERSKREKSFWYEYLELLPRLQTLPIVWSIEEIDNLLVGTELHMVVKEDKKFIQEDWMECIVPLCKMNPYDFPPEDFTLDAYFSAKTLVASRAFEVDMHHGCGMVPLADIFNHRTALEDVHFTCTLTDSESDVEDSQYLTKKRKLGGDGKGESDHQLDTKGENDGTASRLKSGDIDQSNNTHKTLEDSERSHDILEIIVVRNIAKGCEIFNTYGSLSNASLLQRYGFTEPENPYDIVNIDFNLLMEYLSQQFTNRHLRRCVRLWRKSGCTACETRGCEYFEISVCGKPQIELLVLLYIVHLSDDAYEHFDFSISKSGEWIDTFFLALECSGKKISKDLPYTSRTSINAQALVARVSKKSEQRRAAIAISREDSQWTNNTHDLLTRQVCEGLLWLCSKRDSMYGNLSLEEDQVLLQNTNRTDQPKHFHALSLRISERSILRRLQEHVLKILKGIRKSS